jgi:hypothetical protein
MESQGIGSLCKSWSVNTQIPEMVLPSHRGQGWVMLPEKWGVLPIYNLQATRKSTERVSSFADPRPYPGSETARDRR